MNAIVLLLILMTNACALKVLGRGRLMNPIFYFVVFFSLQAMGTLPLLDFITEADRAHAFLLVLASLTILFYVVIFHKSRELSGYAERWQRSPEHRLTRRDTQVVAVAMGSSIVVSVAYYWLVGYNLFLVALAGGAEDFVSLRLAAYSGETYTGAGIVNQFKNTILPVTLFALLFSLYQTKRYILGAAFFAVLMPVFLYCIMGAGQRTYLFFSLVMAAIYYMNTVRISYSLMAVIAVGFVVFFGLFSVTLGRQQGADFVAIIEQLYYRLFIAQQGGALHGFRYVYEQDIQLGYEWWESIRGLIPGVRGSDLSNRVHDLVYGSYRGTAPVSLWVSTYHNFGTLGVVVGTFTLMLLLHQVFRFVVRFERNPINNMLAAAVLLYSGIMVFSTPFQAINNGLPGLILLYVVIRPRSLNGKPVRLGWGDRVRPAKAHL